MLRTFLDTFFLSIQRYWQLYLLLVIALFFMMRLHWSFRVLAAAVFLAFILIAIVGAIVAVSDSVRGVDVKPQFLQNIADRAEMTRNRISDLRSQVREIEAQIEELVNLAGREEPASGGQLGKRVTLLHGYKEELSLRQAKIDFYTRSLQTLTNLDFKWQQEQRLNELQTGLEKLRTSAGPEEQTQMRVLKEELAREQDLLKSYKSLSKRLDKSDSLETTRQLRKELERLLN